MNWKEEWEIKGIKMKSYKPNVWIHIKGVGSATFVPNEASFPLMIVCDIPLEFLVINIDNDSKEIYQINIERSQNQ